MAQHQKIEPAKTGPATGGGKQTPTATTTSTPRRGPGAKEVIPMVWKLVGMSDGMPVTLLKCIDRAEADAQMERLQGERYYKDLAVYGIDDEVPILASAAKARRKAIDDAISKIAARNARVKATRGRGRGSGGTTKEAASKSKKPTPQRAEATAKKPTKVKEAEPEKTAAKPKAKAGGKPKAKAEPKTKAKSAVKAKPAKQAVKKPKAKSTTKAAAKAKVTKREKAAPKPKAAKGKKSARGRK